MKAFKISLALVLILFATVIMVWRYSSVHLSRNQQTTNPSPSTQSATSSSITEAYILKNDFPETNYVAVRQDIFRTEDPPHNQTGTGDFIVSHEDIISRIPFSVFRDALIRDFGDAGDSTITASPISEKFGEERGAFITTIPPRLYLFLIRMADDTEANRNRTDIPAYLYSSNFDGSDARLLYTDSGDHYDLQIVAPDQQTLAIVRFTKFIPDAKDVMLSDAVPQLTILALPSGKVIASLPLPGDTIQYAAQHGLENLSQSEGWLDNIVGAWLINPDGSVEFTRYYGLTQVNSPESDKELWRFDPKTDQLQLLKTVPLGQFKTRL